MPLMKRLGPRRCADIAIWPGVPFINYMNRGDMYIALSWGTGTPLDILSSTGISEFVIGNKETIFVVKQSAAMIPTGVVSSTLQSYDYPKDDYKRRVTAGKVWGTRLQISPVGGPPLVTLLSTPCGGASNRHRARKVIELIDILRQAFCEKRNMMVELAAEMILGVDATSCKYHPFDTPRGHRPQTISDLIRERTAKAEQGIRQALLDPEQNYVTNFNGDVILHLWWLRDNMWESRLEKREST